MSAVGTALPVDLPPEPAAEVEAWRLEQLLRAGWPMDLAEIVARRGDVDLHLACELVARRGATVRQALGILI